MVEILSKALTRILSTIIPSRVSGRGRALVYAGLAIVLAIVFMAIAAPLLTPYDPTRRAGRSFQPPSWEHPFGTNNLGYDMWARTVYGARTVLIVVFLSIVLSMAMGVPLGLFSGYYGGRIDRALSMLMDAIYAFPSLVLAISLAVALGPSLFNAAIAIAVVYVPTYFRMVRGQVLSIKEELFVEVARALGIPTSRIIFRHILPHLIPTIMVVFSLSAADAVLTEAALSYLGLSVQPPTPDWGYDLYKGKGFVLSGYWWLIFFPGLMITLLATGFALIGEGLSEQIRRERL
ncbi:MAG: ABC transporter permease [Thermoprotei archaeon]|nr:MAG: ABC transporter permease [Thermoprotei archaeon]